MKTDMQLPSVCLIVSVMKAVELVDELLLELFSNQLVAAPGNDVDLEGFLAELLDVSHQLMVVLVMALVKPATWVGGLSNVVHSVGFIRDEIQVVLISFHVSVEGSLCCWFLSPYALI